MSRQVKPLFKLGIERLGSNLPTCMASARLGLLMNQASLTGDGQYACDVLHKLVGERLKVLFAPQHGFWGQQQANMIESAHGIHNRLDVPVFSLYADTRRPTAEMLAAIDCLVIDLQDVGTRVYTFVWTMLETLRACAEHAVAVVVLDRPNPLGGIVFEGPMLEFDFRSFVGNATIPLRHGLTIAELAKLFVSEFQIHVDLHIVSMEGWHPQQLWRDLGRPWNWTSPNMPREETTLVYPGQVLLEGVNLSEGRGTTRPFELVGAPYFNAEQFVEELGRFEHCGLRLLPTRFTPMFDKWRGESCDAVDLQVVEPHAVRSVAVTIAVIACARKLYPNSFAWLPPPYEYEYHKPPIDILFGSQRLRNAIELGQITADADIQQLIGFDEDQWQHRVAAIQLYP